MLEKAKEQYERLKSWFLALPWYWKILVFVPLLAVGILVILTTLASPGPQDKGIREHRKMVDNIIEGLKENVEAEKKAINERKIYILKNLELADKMDSETLKRKDRILLAESMEELDKLQEEFQL